MTAEDVTDALVCGLQTLYADSVQRAKSKVLGIPYFAGLAQDLRDDLEMLARAGLENSIRKWASRILLHRDAPRLDKCPDDELRIYFPFLGKYRDMFL